MAMTSAATRTSAARTLRKATRQVSSGNSTLPGNTASAGNVCSVETSMVCVQTGEGASCPETTTILDDSGAVLDLIKACHGPKAAEQQQQRAASTPA